MPQRLFGPAGAAERLAACESESVGACGLAIGLGISLGGP
jgi:hypothetical protein